jgi:four helix bundle protein
MHKYQDLKLWSKGIDLVVDVYKATANLPKEEKYGLTSQMRRCAVSIPSNIAEGAGRNSTKEFVHFLSIANGSNYELETQVIVANRLDLLNNELKTDLCKRLNELQKMNYNLQNRLLENKNLNT